MCVPILNISQAADTIWENRSPISFAAKSGRYLKYRPINSPIRVGAKSADMDLF